MSIPDIIKFSVAAHSPNSSSCDGCSSSLYKGACINCMRAPVDRYFLFIVPRMVMLSRFALQLSICPAFGVMAFSRSNDMRSIIITPDAFTGSSRKPRKCPLA